MGGRRRTVQVPVDGLLYEVGPDVEFAADRFPKHKITDVADPMYANVRGLPLLGEQYVQGRPELFRADGSNVTSEPSEPAESP